VPLKKSTAPATVLYPINQN
jgi:hypothetical protein